MSAFIEKFPGVAIGSVFIVPVILLVIAEYALQALGL